MAKVIGIKFQNKYFLSQTSKNFFLQSKFAKDGTTI